MNNLKIGSFLQALRKAKGLTQQDVADYFCISSKTVSKWECGDSIPEITMLVALANYYEISVDEILKGEKNGSGKPIAYETEEKNRRSREKYLVNKNVNQFILFFYISLAVLLMGFILAFTIAMGFNPWLGFGIGMVFYIGSIITLMIASNRVLYQLDEILEEDRLIEIRKIRFKYLYIYWSILVFCVPLTFKLIATETSPGLPILILFIVLGYLLINYFVIREKMYHIPMPSWLNKLYQFNNRFKAIFWMNIGYFLILLTIIGGYQIDSIHMNINADLLYLLTTHYESVSMYIGFSFLLIAILSALFFAIKQKNHFSSYAFLIIANIFISRWINESYYIDLEYVKEYLRSITNSFSMTSGGPIAFIEFSWIFAVFMMMKVVDLFFDIKIKRGKQDIKKNPSTI